MGELYRFMIGFVEYVIKEYFKGILRPYFMSLILRNQSRLRWEVLLLAASLSFGSVEKI